MPTTKRVCLLLFAWMLASAPGVLAQSQFTLEQVLGSPFPTGLVSAQQANRVAWVFDAKGVRKLWIATIDGKQQGKELATVRGDAVSPKWSPDGKHIAFVSERGSHSFIAVYNFGGDSIHYLAPSVDKDSMPRWSPDGKQIAFVRTP